MHGILPMCFLHGDIRNKWVDLGVERSFLGYPVTDEMDNPDRDKSGRYSRFQGGFISWTPDTGAQAHRDGTNAVFSVDHIFITTTRNGDIWGTAKDTVVVALQMNIGSQVVGPLYKNLGKLKGGGPYPVNFSISAPVNDPAAPVVMSFQMSHSSNGDTAQLRDSSHKGFDALAAAGIGAAAGSIGGPVGAAIGAVAGLVAVAVGGLLFANCDGPVAADTIHVSGATLNDETATASHSETKDYSGYVSQDGCGDNPLYSVAWLITQQV
jgi:LGFP repeat